MKPTLFHLGPLPIHGFGLMVGLGFLFGLMAATRRAKAVGIAPEAIHDLVFPWILLGGLFGARLLYVLTYWERDFAGGSIFQIFELWRGGLVFYGGLVGAILMAMFRIHQKRLPLWKVADCMAPGIALGHVFGRLGCFLNGCCYGHASDAPWAIRFPSGTIQSGDGTLLNHAVHPTQIYEAMLNLGLFGFLMWWHGRRRFDGQVFGIYLVAYAVIRGFTELYRGDYSRISNPANGVLTPGQWAGLVILATGIALLFWLRSRPQGAISPTSQPALQSGSNQNDSPISKDR